VENKLRRIAGLACPRRAFAEYGHPKRKRGAAINLRFMTLWRFGLWFSLTRKGKKRFISSATRQREHGLFILDPTQNRLFDEPTMTPDSHSSPLFRQPHKPSLDHSVLESCEPKVTLADMIFRLVAAQERQNELLEDLIEQMNATQRQKQSELGQWKEANPQLAERCGTAAETLSRVQTEFLEQLTEEVSESADSLVDSEFLMNEFVDRYGPRMAHLNGVLQMLAQLSAYSDRPNAAK
jgi:hypothetical protein